jgi:organic hydroperoxide reductase OsmC/OhrA
VPSEPALSRRAKPNIHAVVDPAIFRQLNSVMSRLPEGRSWVSEVILKPRVTFDAKQQVAASTTAHFHELAQEDCFIARSVKTKVTICGT